MIWYRHWLELRFLVLILCAMGLGASVGFGFIFGPAWSYMDHSNMRGPLAAIDVHYIYTFMAALLVGLGSAVMQGTGLVVPKAARSLKVFQSVYFTASLPFSRARFVCSRIATAGAGLSAALVIMLLLYALMLQLIGLPMPLLAMTKTTVFGIAVAFALIALATYLGLLVSGLVTGVALFAATIWLGESTQLLKALVATATEPTLGVITGLAAASLLLVAATLVTVRRREL